jgi:hypothetical protein
VVEAGEIRMTKPVTPTKLTDPPKWSANQHVNPDGTYKLPFEDRFWQYVRKTDTCWEWTAGGRKRYGLFNLGGGRGQISAHRLSYMLIKGEIPDGLTLDHLCRNPSCVNPDHLEPVTSGVNTLRGDSVTSVNNRKTHCNRGHSFSGVNLILRPTGGRDCLTCRLVRSRLRSTEETWEQVEQKVKVLLGTV